MASKVRLRSERGEIGLDPVDARGEPAGGGEHLRVAIGPRHPEPAAGELDPDPAGAAAGVEHGHAWPRPEQRLDERRLAVDVLARRGECVEPHLVVVARRVARCHLVSLRTPFLSVQHQDTRLCA